ncbi:distal membrane-arm assembly complex protein 1, partial [Lagopus leucura]|uniref:distal membrane-arm assembly complex protein 1 n=1 Tax=Lagopus leucura TaxID=30410 RepID=UPI001C686E8F
ITGGFKGDSSPPVSLGALLRPRFPAGAPRGEPGAAGGAAAAQRAGAGGPAGSGQHRGERGQASRAVAEVRGCDFREPSVTSVRFRVTSGGCVASPVYFRFASSHLLGVPWLPADMPSTSGAMASDQRTLLSRCWSCRFLGGFALLAAAAWIYRRPRALIRSGVTPGMGDVAQITFAICERRENGGG